MNNFFAINLKYLRERHGMSKTDLSKKINVHQSTISRWENGAMGATVDNAYDISEIFNIPMSELLGKDLRLNENKKDIDGIYIQKADGTSVFLKNASNVDKALVELPEEQKKAILTMIGKTIDEIDKELDGK